MPYHTKENTGILREDKGRHNGISHNVTSWGPQYQNAGEKSPEMGVNVIRFVCSIVKLRFVPNLKIIGR